MKGYELFRYIKKGDRRASWRIGLQKERARELALSFCKPILYPDFSILSIFLFLKCNMI